MKRYENYRETVSPFLSSVPAHWTDIRIGHSYAIKSIGGHQDEPLLSVFLNRGVVSYTDTDMKQVHKPSEDMSAYQLVEPSDFVLNNQQAWRGSVGVSKYRGIVSPAYIVMKPTMDNNPKFMNYKLPDLLEKLQKLLDGAIDGTTHYGNPVTDYAPTRTLAVIPKKEAEYNVSVEEKEIQMENAEEDEPKGFLDFQAEIDEQAKLLTQEIVEVGADMVEMTKSINNANSEIQRVKQNGSLNASFAQRVLKGLSEPVQKFSQDLKGHVERMGQSWQIIENGYLGLLENEFMLKENNLQSLPRTRKSLTQLKTSMIESNLRYKNLIVSSETCLGLERRLNKAIHSLTSELDGYLSMTGVMVASIDRIVARIDVVISNKGCFYGQ